MATRALSAKQTAYLNARIEGLDPSAAYRRAYDCEGSSASTVAKNAMRLEKHTLIAPMLEQSRQQAIEAAEITAEVLVKELTNVAFGNLADVAPWDEAGPRLIPSADLTPEQQRLVTSIKVKRQRIEVGPNEAPTAWEVEYLEIKRQDPQAAIDKLMRYLGAYAPEKKEVTGKDGLPLIPDSIRTLDTETLRRLAYAGDGTGA